MSKKKKGRKKKTNKIGEYFNKHKTKVIGTVVTLVIFLAVGYFVVNSNNNYVLKSEYKMGELGFIDDIEITLTDANYINNETGVEVSFEITNKRDNTITITPDDYFVFYDINKVQIPNKFTNDKSIIKKDETITYKLQYDVTKKELYEIYFYSQIVENNIKFSFTANDIVSDIPEESITPEKEIDEYE